jgi:hypothetical protein
MNIISKLIALYRREPAATQAAVAAIWGAAIVIDRAWVEHVAVFNWQVAMAGLVALYGLLVRAQVIPVAKIKASLRAGMKGEPTVFPPGPPS